MKCNKLLVIVLTIIFIMVFFSCSYILLKDYSELKENDNSNENLIIETIEIDEETQEKSIDWNYLKSVNGDIIGWIEIEDTKINYPILQDNSNLYYLKHTYNKKYSSSGSIFTTNEKPFIEKETIIYGHNMKNGSMFSSLDKYLDKDYLNSHQNFTIYTPAGNYKATVFSAYSIGFDVESNNIKQLGFDERLEYYKKASRHCIEDIGIPEKIIKLSTCSYINAKTTPTDQRYYIIASIIPMK